MKDIHEAVLSPIAIVPCGNHYAVTIKGRVVGTVEPCGSEGWGWRFRAIANDHSGISPIPISGAIEEGLRYAEKNRIW